MTRKRNARYKPKSDVVVKRNRRKRPALDDVIETVEGRVSRKHKPKRRTRRKRRVIKEEDHKIPFDFVDKKSVHGCYLAYNTQGGWGYVGYSVNPVERVWKHAGLREGGAKKAKVFVRGKRWREPDPNMRLLVVVCRFLNRRDGLKFEKAWQLACKNGKQTKKALEYVLPALTNPDHKWTKKDSTLPVWHPLRESNFGKYTVFWMKDCPIRGFDPRSLPSSPYVDNVFDASEGDVEAHWQYLKYEHCDISRVKKVLTPLV